MERPLRHKKNFGSDFGKKGQFSASQSQRFGKNGGVFSLKISGNGSFFIVENTDGLHIVH